MKKESLKEKFRKELKKIFKKRQSKKHYLEIFFLIGLTAANKLIKWRYGMADPSPLMTTLYAIYGKTEIYFRKKESGGGINYSLTFEMPIRNGKKKLERSFSYSCAAKEKKLFAYSMKEIMSLAWIFCEFSARENEK